VQAFRGKGSVTGASMKAAFEYGVKSTTERDEVTLNYNMEQGEKTFQDIIDAIRGHVPDASLDSFCYMEAELKLGPGFPSSVRCDWARESIQTGKMQGMVVDGNFPNKAISMLIEEIQTQLNGLPAATRARFRKSFMTLKTEPDINHDEYAVKALRYPNMLFIKERQMPWVLGDWEYKPRG